MKVTVAALSAGALMLCCGLVEAQTLDQQAKCAAQARIAYTEIEAQRRPEQLKYGNKDITGTFSSYLNLRLNRCFVMIERTFTDFNKSYASETDLTDAISRHGYAFYSDRNGKMLTCDLSPPGKARVICASREEFDAFTAHTWSDGIVARNQLYFDESSLSWHRLAVMCGTCTNTSSSP
jgi:hypothetical protein